MVVLTMTLTNKMPIYFLLFSRHLKVFGQNRLTFCTVYDFTHLDKSFIPQSFGRFLPGPDLFTGKKKKKRAVSLVLRPDIWRIQEAIVRRRKQAGLNMISCCSFCITDKLLAISLTCFFLILND
ncbi:hypothetical protein GOODEAATRI_024261 [Goodea atripinnis]|uniref:Uncharacterized protein n=1 Tax=Goodea atripinnis TaxID=208336 RepID=A0ABV0NXG6_9TELE